MKQRIAFIIAGLLIILFFLVWWIPQKTDEDPDTVVRAEKRRVEPEFDEGGILYFINSESADTLSRLTIEIVDNEADINQGLMNRSNLGADRGMFFTFGREEERIFWMKNTMIPLDIIFVNSSLEIIHIAKHTIPYSEEPVMSMGLANYVIEVEAGYADYHGITPSDHIRYLLKEPGNPQTL